MAEELGPQSKQGRRGQFLGDHWNHVKLKVLISGRRCFKERRHNVHCVSIGERGVKQQVTAIFDIAEVQSQRAAIRYNCTDWFILILAVCQPYATSPPVSSGSVVSCSAVT